MIYLIIGHRGVGKTSWLKKLEKLFIQYKKQALFIDLDDEIQKQTGKSIDFLIQKNKFRGIEKNILYQLVCKYKNISHPVFIALGAGFDLKGFYEEHIRSDNRQARHIFSNCKIIHLMRETDSQGRVFLDRPRLNLKLSPYEEYSSFYKERQKLYQKFADEKFILPEWDFTFNTLEKLFFYKELSFLNEQKIKKAIITLNKNSLPEDETKWKNFINKRLKWDFCFFELRDDDWSSEELYNFLNIIPKQKLILSFRKSEESVFLKQDLSSVLWDWSMEKEEKPPSVPAILSLHQRGDDLKVSIKNLMQHKAHHYKLAVPVYNLEELLTGHHWFLKDPACRSFLPLSSDGQWRWYRQVYSSLMKLHFIRESLIGVKDQPYLHEHLINCFNFSRETLEHKFYAVLGDPIKHSASPAEYREDCAKQNMLFVKILLFESEFTKKNLKILQNLGLIFCAVTSPLKKKAFQLCDELGVCAQAGESVNTMRLKKDQWQGFSTDGQGLKVLLKSVPKDSVVVWGGGGLKNILQAKLPLADFYSARTGKKDSYLSKQIGNEENEEQFPQCVIWAVGRSRMKGCLFPPSAWKPKLVVDLNYTADSPGKEYALLTGAAYVSGWEMFKEQARVQKSFFTID